MLFHMRIQCTDKATNTVGTYIADETGKAISPICAGVYELVPWMRENKWECYQNDGPLGVRKVQGECVCPACRKKGNYGEGCPTCPGFWYVTDDEATAMMSNNDLLQGAKDAN